MENPRRIAHFGPFAFDLDRLELRSGGIPVPLQPQPTAVLAALLHEPGRLVTRDELRDSVWADRIVEFDAGINFSIRQVRLALDDDAATPTYVTTVHRRGYRFIAPVRWETVTPDAARGGKQGSAPSRARLWAGLATGAAAALTAVLIFGDAPASPLATSLPEPTRTTYEAARYLYERGEIERALVRIDSVRLAAPDFAGAWALASHVYRRLNNLAGARAAAERAVRIEPDLADAHYALGRVAFMQLEGATALAAFERASALDPRNITYRQWYAQTLANALRLDDAIQELEEARRIDPLTTIIGVDLAEVYLAAGRYDDAHRYCSATLDLVSDAEAWARNCLMSVYHLRGDSGAATAEAHALMQLNGASPNAVSQVTSVTDYFRWNLARIDQAPPDARGNPFQRVRATARLFDRDETLRGLESMQAARHFGLQWAPRDVWLQFLHGDPEFERILREAGLPVPPSSS